MPSPLIGLDPDCAAQVDRCGNEIDDAGEKSAIVGFGFMFGQGVAGLVTLRLLWEERQLLSAANLTRADWLCSGGFTPSGIERWLEAKLLKIWRSLSTRITSSCRNRDPNPVVVSRSQNISISFR